MSINLKKQSQFELFPKVSKNNPEMGKVARLTKDLTLSLENIIVLCIIFIMALVLFFSFGVEKGKRIAQSSHRAGEAGLIQTAEGTSEKNASGPRQKGQGGEKVVSPVEAPKGSIGESRPTFESPLEGNGEGEKLFTIQVASFKLKKNAQREADHLKEVGHKDAFVMPKGSYSIVCVGKFARRNEAKKLSSQLQSRYNDCLVRRL